LIELYSKNISVERFLAVYRRRLKEH